MKQILFGLVLSLVASPSLAQTSLLPTLERFRVLYPTPMSPGQLGDFLNRVAWEHRTEGWGLLKKTAGNRCPAPQGIEVACDILVYAPMARHFDVLIDAGGASTPTWIDKGPCDPSVSGCDMSRFTAPVKPADGRGNTDLNGDLHPDLVWQHDSTRQVSIWYMGGQGGDAFQGWSWLTENGTPGWRVAGTGDFNGDGKLDVVWVHDTTRQVSLWYMTGPLGNVMQSWTWLSMAGYPGWHIAAVEDVNGDGKPDIVAQNDATRQVSVIYLGGAQGTTMLGWDWLAPMDVPGCSLVAVRDFDGDGMPDLLWQNDTTRQVSIWYMTTAGGTPTMKSWAWVSVDGVPSWKVVGAGDFNADGRVDIVWQNEITRQVAVWYMTGTLGNVMVAWSYLAPAAVPGWSAIVR